MTRPFRTSQPSLPHALAPVLVGDVAADPAVLQEKVGAVGRELGDHGVVRESLAQFFGDLAQPGLVGHRHLPGAADGDRLEVLGAHDGSGPAAAGRPLLVVHDAGQKHLLLSGRADAGDLDLRIVPSSARMASWVWSESSPQSADASRISALPSFIHR